MDQEQGSIDGTIGTTLSYSGTNHGELGRWSVQFDVPFDYARKEDGHPCRVVEVENVTRACTPEELRLINEYGPIKFYKQLPIKGDDQRQWILSVRTFYPYAKVPGHTQTPSGSGLEETSKPPTSDQDHVASTNPPTLPAVSAYGYYQSQLPTKPIYDLPPFKSLPEKEQLEWWRYESYRLQTHVDELFRENSWLRNLLIQQQAKEAERNKPPMPVMAPFEFIKEPITPQRETSSRIEEPSGKGKGRAQEGQGIKLQNPKKLPVVPPFPGLFVTPQQNKPPPELIALPQLPPVPAALYRTVYPPPAQVVATTNPLPIVTKNQTTTTMRNTVSNLPATAQTHQQSNKLFMRRSKSPHKASAIGKSIMDRPWYCLLCKEDGHTARHCPKKPTPSKPCFICTKEGHWAQSCPDIKPRSPLRGAQQKSRDVTSD
jgi:hypothetical protein